jgi:hypothetical protein
MGLCLDAPADFSTDLAKRALRQFRRATQKVPRTDPIPIDEEAKLIKANTAQCKGMPYWTVYEKFAFSNTDRVRELHSNLSGAIEKIPGRGPGADVFLDNAFKTSGEINALTRKAVLLLRPHLNAPLTPDEKGVGLIDADLYVKILIAKQRPVPAKRQR